VGFWIEFDRLGPGRGRESKSVSGGDEPGLLPTAGTMPTIPDDTARAEFVEGLPLLAAASGTTDAELVGAAAWGLSCEAATVASGLPLGSTNVTSSVAATVASGLPVRSTNVTSPVGAAAFLGPAL
jgi:hypothetical protein